MNNNEVLTETTKTIKSNSPEILTALAVAGVIATSYLAVRATFKAAKQLKDEPDSLSFKERAKRVWKCYVPAGISGALTIGSIIGASKASENRTAAAVTACALTERAFSEYRDKVTEEVGKNKAQTIRDKIAQDKVSKTPTGTKETFIIGAGDVLCCELLTRRYFRSSAEKLKKAEIEINACASTGMTMSLEDFYDLVGLEHTSESGRRTYGIGWDANCLLQLNFSSVLTQDGEPCLAFAYDSWTPMR